MGDSAWVTQSLEEENVNKAIVLGKSLRKVLTRKSLVVIVRPSISLALRDALETTYDFVLSLDEAKCGQLEDLKLSSNCLAKCFAFNFTFFDQCIFLPPNSLLLKNCDHLFDTDDKLGREKIHENCGGESGSTTLYFQPSRDMFKKITSYFTSLGNEPFDSSAVFLKWIQNQHRDQCLILKEQYSTVVKMQEEHFLKNDDDFSIVHLVDLPVNVDLMDPEKNGLSKAGLLEKFIYRYWLDIYKNEVKTPPPIINGIPGKHQHCTNSSQNYNHSRNNNKEPIAVVGMSCRYPSSNNLSEFWNLLIEGKDGIRTAPQYRWTKEQSLNHNPEARKTQAGFLTVPVDEFDARFFGISPKEMIFIDPQHRILHECVWEALEDGGINPLGLHGSQTGVFMGSWRNDYYDILQRSSSREFFRGYMGNSIGAGAARISHLLGLTGPCVATESGCSAAMVAVHMACRSLQFGESNMAIACGVNLLLHPFTTDIMPMVTAPDGHCKSFAADADGFGRAEGCGVLVLKRLSEAVRDGDNILGLIKGTAIAQEGISKSMGTPTIQCESQAMRQALRDANVHPSQVSYVESHGTGTIVGDPMEVAAIGKVYAEGRQEPLVIGSVKTNVGHTESCSGITGIMKVILSMKNEVIPPHRNFQDLNPDINLESIPAKLPLEPINWPRMPNGIPRTAGISSFGITGTDGHVIVQEPLQYPSQSITLPGFERPLHLMTITAKTEEALDSLLERYKVTLSNKDHHEDTFRNMAYTTNVGRAIFNWRAALVAKDAEDAVEVLGSNKLLRSEVSEDMTGKICFLFTGQGSQYYGMGKELYETSPLFRMHFDQCEKILVRKYKVSIAKAFWGNEDENVSLVNRSLYSQTGIFVMEYCLMKLWESWGVKADFVLGHSLGEFCAAVCAKIITFEEALILVAERSRLIDRLPEGKMLVVKADKSSVDNLLTKFTLENNEFEPELDYAAINANDQTVLAGATEKIFQFSEWLKRRSVKTAVLQSTHAFHSRHMDPMLQEYRRIAEKIFKNKPKVKPGCGPVYVSGMLGKILDSPIDWPEYWVQHTREKVNFINASKAVYNVGGCRLFLEVGPHPVLTALTMVNNDGKQLVCLPSLRRNETDWMTMLGSLAKLFVSGALEINWKRFHQFYEKQKVGQLLPTYPFQGTKYWPSIHSSTGVEIHPLLGSSIPNATNAKLFQNNISFQNAEFLKDHVIGTTVVFPGAGYLETLLMAGHVTLDGVTTEFRYPRRPIQLENFRIEAPMGLEEGVRCNCQTIVEYNASQDSDSSVGLFVKFYHEKKEGDEGMSKWIQHATGSFSPYIPGNGIPVDVDTKEYYKEAMTRLRTTGKDESTTKEFYDKVADVGLKFGPSFQSLSKVWRGAADENKTEFLAEVKIPKDAGNYLVHPTLIDAMIQASVFHGEDSKKIEKKLRVPLGCERFVWFKPLTDRTTTNESKVESHDEITSSEEENHCYIYSTGRSKTIILLNKDGHPVAALVKVEAIETNAKSIQALLETQVKSIPDFYKINWKPTLGPEQKRLDFSIIEDIVDVIEKGILDHSDYSEINLQIQRDIDKLVSLYAIIAFLNLGWNPKPNDRITLDKFLAQLGISLQHKQLVRQFLVYLETENILEGMTNSSNDEREWLVKEVPEGVEPLEKLSNEIVQRISIIDSYTDRIMLLQNIGKHMSKVLDGTGSPLRILFPENESKPSVGKFYDAVLKHSINILVKTWGKTWENVRKVYEQHNLPLPKVRFLEVGAGTGFMTEYIIQGMEAHEIPYEYHYTDISAAFFAAAEKRFEKSKRNFKFRKLNLEVDATSQGFAPKYFDFIIAAQVVHATRDIKETFLNLRQLLKEGGNLLLNDQFGSIRENDCIFGVLDGYWKFTDFELRPHHPMLTAEMWKEVGKMTGFSKSSHCYDFQYGFVMYRADKDEKCSYDLLSKSMNLKMQNIHKTSMPAWLIFFRQEEEKYVEELRRRFEFIGRKTVILVKHLRDIGNLNLKNCISTPIKSKYELRTNQAEEMERWFSIMSASKDDPNGFSTIEGIIVTWGLFGDGEDQSEFALPFLNLTQNLIKMDKKAVPQVIVLSSGQYPLGDILCKNPSPSTLLGMAKCIANEHSELRIRGIDISPTELLSNVDEIFQEIFTGFNDEVAHFCAFRGGERFIPKMVPERTSQNKCLALPPCTDRFQLIHPKSKSIQDLEFGDLEVFTLKPNEIEVRVKCSALNFKDILNILKPTEEFKDSNGVGFDFAGVVTAVGEGVTGRQVGDPVFGINIMGNALPSHIKLLEDAVASVPDSCTFTEAACFPAVFSTAYFCLIHVADAKKGDTLLVHTASGGVGLLAVQLANYFGLQIICTAGSQRKRAYLRSLGIQHVFHSRTTKYGEEILKATNGKGVDIVLNSLTSPGFKEATLGACAVGARFVEMSKLNIWTKEEVAARRPDVRYTVVDLTTLDEATSRQLLGESRKLLEKGVIKPIPYTRFDAQSIREALTYLQKAHHIGKVVVTMPELKSGQIERTQMYTPLFNERSTYLITGGLGGVGMEVCKYLIDQGARNVVLVGRKPPTEQTAAIIQNLNIEKGCNIVVLQGDVGDLNQCSEVFRKMKDPQYNLPPLRGIMHCAGTIADALIENVKWDDFLTTYQAKVKGSWNLHNQTKDAILEHFVLFSSVVAPFGSPGQATHVSACTFEDTMAHFRHSHGLPATTINWGQFGQVGVAAEADVFFIRPFTPQQGMNALDLILRENRNYTIVASFENSLVGAVKFLPYTKRVIDSSVFKQTDTGSSKKSLQLSHAQFWDEYNNCKDEREAKVEVVKGFTKKMLRHVLRLDAEELIDENMDLQDMGVDSLMMLEMKNHIQEVLGDRATITQSALKDCNSIQLLSKRLVQIIEEEGEFSSVEPPTLEQVHQTIMEDSLLPGNIRAEVPGSEKKASDIEVLLMTGATGVLGSHMLREILEECPQLEKVICLVRTRGGQSAEDRLTSVLERACVMGYLKNFHKVQCISGNFIEERLGLPKADYEHLAREVDAVLHCGAKVNHVEYYRTVNGGRSDARSVNVGGFLKVLEFCGSRKTKHFFNASTILCITDADERDGTLSECWPDREQLSVTHNRGYQNSKYVQDLLLREATEQRGIPCKSFRYAELRGSTVTGSSLLETSHFMRTYLFFMMEGIMPETPLVSNFLPINLAAKITAHIIFKDDAPNQAYNVSHPQPQLLQEYFPNLAEEMGHHVELVDFETYRKRTMEILNSTQEKDKEKVAILGEFRDLYKDEETIQILLSGAMPSVRKFIENASHNFWKSKRLLELVPELYSNLESSYEINKRDFLAARKEGLFENLGL